MPPALLTQYGTLKPEAGCDEVGRGCLAGPVVAAAVILPDGFDCPELRDSKKLSASRRGKLRHLIETEAVAWAVAMATNTEIDELNILNASILAMHRAVEALQIAPAMLLVDGNRFQPYPNLPHVCVVGGDDIYQSIAAASVLAKTHRDALMASLHKTCPEYGWNTNMGYPTPKHLQALIIHGRSPYHRLTFRPKVQLKLML